LPGEWDTA